MRTKHLKFLLACLLACTFASGFFVESSSGQGEEETTIPPDAEIIEATLNIYVIFPTGQQINVHRVTGEWDEYEVTWGNFEQSFDEDPIASFKAAETGWVSCDVTKLVKDWMNGVSDHGLLLDQTVFYYPRTRFNSREHTTNKPYLEISYTSGGGKETAQLFSVADASISEKKPELNDGLVNVLYLGWNTASDLEMQCLIDFDIPVPTECQGHWYWRKHSKYGSGPYNDAWAELPEGEDTPFFLSGKSFYEALCTKPKKGFAYYKLARAYISAQLNIFNGCYAPPEIVVDMTQAFEIFAKLTPKQMLKLKKKHKFKKQIMKIAKDLFKFNKGKFH